MQNSKKILARSLVLVLSFVVAANLMTLASARADENATSIAGIPVEQPNGAPPVAPRVVPVPAATVASSIPVETSADAIVASSVPGVQPSTVAGTIPTERPDHARARQVAKKKVARVVAPKVRRNTPALRVGFIWPVKKAETTSPFGWRPWIVMPGERGPHPARQFHHGEDIACNLNDPVDAAKGGTVILSGVNPDYGNVIVIQHAAGWSTLYGHLNKRIAIVGRYVRSGQLIGLCGKTGRATGTHLHFEVRRLGRFYNPVPFLP